MEQRDVTTIEVAEQKLKELINGIPTTEAKTADDAKAKAIAVDAAVKMSGILSALLKDDLEREKLASAHDLKLEGMALEREKLATEAETERIKSENSAKEKDKDRELSYEELKAKIDESVERAKNEARKARAELRRDGVTLGTTIISGLFQLGQLSALRDVVGAGEIHMKLLPFLFRR